MAVIKVSQRHWTSQRQLELTGAKEMCTTESKQWLYMLLKTQYAYLNKVEIYMEM